MSHETVNGLRYAIEEAGAGEPLLLLHGFTGSRATWRDLWPQLATRFRVLAIDLPGHGGSDAPVDPARYTIFRVAADLVEILKRRAARPAHWLGYSMGGRLALYAALHHPGAVRALLLESASPGLATASERQQRRAADESLALRIERDGVARFVDEWERLPLFAGLARLPAEAQAELRRQRLANSAAGLANSLRGMGTGAQPSLWERLPELAVPTLLVVGAEDDKFVAINRRMAARRPAAELRVVPDAGHTIHLEQPAAFLAAILSFLDAGELQPERQHLTEGEQDGEGQRRQRQLLEPGVERGQVFGAADGQAVAHQRGRGQQEEKLPGRGVRQPHIGHGAGDGEGQE